MLTWPQADKMYKQSHFSKSGLSQRLGELETNILVIQYWKLFSWPTCLGTRFTFITFLLSLTMLCEWGWQEGWQLAAFTERNYRVNVCCLPALGTTKSTVLAHYRYDYVHGISMLEFSFSLPHLAIDSNAPLHLLPSPNLPKFG